MIMSTAGFERSAENTVARYFPIGTAQAPHTKNSRNIMIPSRVMGAGAGVDLAAAFMQRPLLWGEQNRQ